MQAVCGRQWGVPGQLGLLNATGSFTLELVRLGTFLCAADDEVPRGHSDPERRPCALTAQIQLILLTPLHAALLLPTHIAPPGGCK